MSCNYDGCQIRRYRDLRMDFVWIDPAEIKVGDTVAEISADGRIGVFFVVSAIHEEDWMFRFHGRPFSNLTVLRHGQVLRQARLVIG